MSSKRKWLKKYNAKCLAHFVKQRDYGGLRNGKDEGLLPDGQTKLRRGRG